jgi:hypothetical protein
MKCDSRASLLARTFASPSFGHEPKAKVATNNVMLFSIQRPKVENKHIHKAKYKLKLIHKTISIFFKPIVISFIMYY